MALRCSRCGARPWPELPPLPSNTVPVAEVDRKGFEFELPQSHRYTGEGAPEPARAYLPWAGWVSYAQALNKEIALRMREYGGPAEQEEPPLGGTPVEMSMRRAA